MILVLRGLIFSNPLIVDKVSHQFLYQKDSGFLVAKEIIQSMPDNYRYYWVIPDRIAEHKWFKEANQNVQIVPYPYSTNIHQNRFEFYGDIFRGTFPYGTDIDFIMCHQPEVTGSIKTWVQNQRRDNPVVLSFHHWIDCEASRKFGAGLQPFFLRSWEGYLASDINYFHCAYAHSLFAEEADNNISGLAIRDKRVGFFKPPPFPNESVKPEPIPLPSEKIIVFNHRLNQTTCYDEVLEICAGMYQGRQDFVLWITDVNRMKYSKERYPFVIEQALPEAQYKYLLQSAHFSVCNHRGYSTWNMAIVDSYHNGCLALIPKRDVYLDMFAGTKAEVFHSNKHDLQELMKIYLDKGEPEIETITKRVIADCPNLFARDSFDYSPEIIKLIEERCSGKMPLGYDNVRQYIIETDGCYKQDWVNKFWEFHVNSNFQKIRWNLLLDGVNDNTKRHEVFYSEEPIVSSEARQEILF